MIIVSEEPIDPKSNWFIYHVGGLNNDCSVTKYSYYWIMSGTVN